MRLFAAIVPPTTGLRPHADALGALDLSQARPAAVERWHVTVAFYGERGGSARLERRLAAAAARTPLLRLALVGAGTFGRSLLWAGLDGDITPLKALMRAAADADAGPARPHVTLARGRTRTADLRPLARALVDVRGPMWTAQELVLFRSTLGPRARHDPMARWPFDATA